MKKINYLAIFICLLCLGSCQKDQIHEEELESKDFSLSASATPECPLNYNFIGYADDGTAPITDPVTGQRTFLFKYDFSNNSSCNNKREKIEVYIEFRSDPDIWCVGYPSNNTPSSHTYLTPITSLSGTQLVYYNPINQLQDKVFMYRTVMKVRSCFDLVECYVEGPWQGPLCSYIWEEFL
ncbi:MULTISPECIES: hypothetical protein [Mesonia]|uniref:Uncharacterized protein n=1 Tax=Mesonia oceanica TaxID=2687242 RepID=A0AC61Y7C0_9FLAO|nr:MULTISPECIES: hypothetical protein [Mesonia]MAN26849.1 hypothetical protein [Mesonia sp.]MAQ40549.1 hypothetical protein [Mesonia sp.]MBJ98239.1 hypothetical protein [Flavobacteriaceae bacterium]VVV00391.1 hypothetical protein FVB9532_01661 [Mesonia oceanica]|tara:strand:- start:4665 stop:5207 length:543 start_codon:yes stop_codon:yes gene_type:complete